MKKRETSIKMKDCLDFRKYFQDKIIQPKNTLFIDSTKKYFVK
jgi:hypothetical protein